jgi:hypothetical protein
LKNDGTPDMRYKENQEAPEPTEAQTSFGEGELFSHIFL